MNRRATSEHQLVQDMVTPPSIPGDTGESRESAPCNALGEYLRDKRQEQGMTIEQIARTTKIPRTSLQHLEDGQFDRLPGDVFVRGFLRAYAGCIGINAVEVVERYNQCGLSPAPVSSSDATSFLTPKKVADDPVVADPAGKPRRTRFARASTASDMFKKALGIGAEEGGDEVLPETAAPVESVVVTPVAQAAQECNTDTLVETNRRIFIPPALQFDDAPKRGPLTLGVIILVIVATLTMSYLLRRPGSSVNGFTSLESQVSPSSDQLG